MSRREAQEVNGCVNGDAIFRITPARVDAWRDRYITMGPEGLNAMGRDNALDACECDNPPKRNKSLYPGLQVYAGIDLTDKYPRPVETIIIGRFCYNSPPSPETLGLTEIVLKNQGSFLVTESGLESTDPGDGRSDKGEKLPDYDKFFQD